MPVYYSATDSRDYRLQLEIVESSQDITNNTTTISYWLFLRALGSFFFQDFESTIALTIDGVSILNTTTQRVTLPSANSMTLITSGTRVINHAADGTKSLPFSASFRTNNTTTFTPIPTHTISGSLALTTIPRASVPTLNVSTQVMGSAITISTNRASTSFTHILKFNFGNQSGTIATGVTTTHSWTLPLSLANAIPNGTSGSGTITCETYNGSTLIGTRTVTFTATVPTSIVPTVSISHSATPSYQNLYIATVTSSLVVLSALGAHGSTIISRSTTVRAGSNTISTSTANSFKSAVIQVSGTITITSTVTDSRGRTGTSTVTFTSNAYPSPTLNVSSQALGSAITISTNRLHTSFTHILKFVFGNQSGTIATGVGDSTSWTLPNSLANAIPNSQSGSGSITCETYNGSTLIGVRTVAFTATVPNNATFQPNASITSITEGQSGLTTFSVFIQNISRLRVQSTGSGNFGATISQQRVTIDGGHLFGANVTFNPINKNGTLTVTLLVTDSRGYSRTVTQNVTLVAYFAPRINSLTADRSPTDQGTDLSAPINFEIATVSNQNTRLYRVRYRVSGGSWVLLFESRDFYSRVFTHTASGVLNVNNSYEIELFVEDAFTSVVRTVTITTAFDLVNYNASGKGIAFGKVSESDSLEVALPANFADILMQNGIELGRSFFGMYPLSNSLAAQHPNSINLNALTQGGIHRLGDTPVNAPSGSAYGHVLVIRRNEADTIAQIVFPFGADEIYFRRGTMTSFVNNSWVRLWHDGNSYPIIETGSNANGAFIRFADGTMIAWSEASITTTATIALENGGFRSTTTVLSLPVTFHAAPRVVASSRNSTRDVGLYAESTNVSTLSIIFKTISSDPTSRVHIAHWIAIGRWKA